MKLTIELMDTTKQEAPFYRAELRPVAGVGGTTYVGWGRTKQKAKQDLMVSLLRYDQMDLIVEFSEPIQGPMYVASTTEVSTPGSDHPTLVFQVEHVATGTRAYGDSSKDARQQLEATFQLARLPRDIPLTTPVV